jgi:Fe-S cluster assembly iron-binding protein IscA
MKDIISISDKAADQIKKILSKSPDNVNGIIIGVDKTGCSGYAYKIEYATNINSNDYSNNFI